MFLKYSEKTKAEKLQIEKEIAGAKNKCSNLDKLIEAATEFASKLKHLWDLGDYYVRQKLQFMLFPEGIFYDKKKDSVRTGRVNSVFACFVALARVFREKKSGGGNLKLLSPLWWRIPESAKKNDKPNGIDYQKNTTNVVLTVS